MSNVNRHRVIDTLAITAGSLAYDALREHMLKHLA